MKLRSMKVTEVNEYIKRVLSFDPILSNIYIEGEISNFKLHSSGHAYFSLKDRNSKINCVMFRSSFSSVQFVPKDGHEVQVNGRVSVYERDGKYQLYVDAMTQVGAGELYQKFMLLKDELKQSGYFEKTAKLHKYPTKIGIISSPTSAALRDILKVLERRNKNLQLIIYPVHVQGDNAKFEISTAIDYFNESMDVDTIIIARGGGSIEELWSFNELMVAEAIFHSKIPVISGVGHETDFTIADFVADIRAATPSEAAEIATAPLDELKKRLLNSTIRLNNAFNNAIDLKRVHLEQYSPKRLCKLIDNDISIKTRCLSEIENRLVRSIQNLIEKYEQRLNSIGVKLHATSPLATLERGYAIIEKDGTNIKSIDDIEMRDIVDIVLKNGIIKTEVISKEREVINGK